MAMLLATILDPRCKRTHGWPNELRERVKVELKVQYDEIKPQNNTQPEEIFLIIIHQLTVFTHIFLALKL